LHRNLKLEFINNEPKWAVEHLMSGIKPATLKNLIERKLEMNRSDLKKDFLEFNSVLGKIAIVNTKNVTWSITGRWATQARRTRENTTATLAAEVLDTTLGNL
jgi:ribosomal protein S17E